MSRNSRLLCLLVACCLLLDPVLLPSQSIQPAYTSFKPGEKITFRFHYGFINVGTASLDVGHKLVNIDGTVCYALKGIGLSNDFWSTFFPVRDYYESFVDTATLLPLVSLRDIDEGSYSSYEKLRFDRENNRVNCNDKPYIIPPNVMDILSAIYYCRSIDLNRLSRGKENPLYTFFEKELFKVGITVTGKKEVETELGTFRCLVLKPTLVEGRVFKGQKDMTVYVTDDRNHLPVLIETAIFVGYIRAEITSYSNLRWPLGAKVK